MDYLPASAHEIIQWLKNEVGKDMIVVSDGFILDGLILACPQIQIPVYPPHDDNLAFIVYISIIFPEDVTENLLSPEPLRQAGDYWILARARSPPHQQAPTKEEARCDQCPRLTT